MHSQMVDLALSGITALAGFGLLLKATRDRIKCNHALSWPTAQGKVLDSRLREDQDSEGKTGAVYIVEAYSANGEPGVQTLAVEDGKSAFPGQWRVICVTSRLNFDGPCKSATRSTR